MERHPSGLDIALDPEVRAHKIASHFSLSKNWEAVQLDEDSHIHELFLGF